MFFKVNVTIVFIHATYNYTKLYTVFDLFSGLFAYVIFGHKNALFSEPPGFYFFVSRPTVSVHYAICFIFYVLSLRLFRVQNATSEDRCM